MMVPARDETRTKVFGTLWVMSPRGGPWPLWPLFVPSIFPTQRLLEMKVLVLCINFPSIRKSPLTSSLVPLLYFLLPCSVNGEGVRGRRACLSETLIADAVQLQVGEGVKRRHSNWLCVHFTTIFNLINQLVFFCTFPVILILPSYLCMMGKGNRDDVCNKIVAICS